MPKSYNQGEAVPYIDIRIFADGKAITSKGETPYFTEYCVTEVPTPHGRLIDAGDAVITLKANKRENEAKGYILAADEYEIVRWIDKLPTIIEAEEGADHE